MQSQQSHDETAGGVEEPRGGTSRRTLLKAGAALAAGGALAHLQPADVLAQGRTVPDTATEIRDLQAQRRILLRGGIVLTLDPDVGDFPSADVLIENGKIREVRPNIAVAEGSMVVVDASNTIVMPGFIDTHHHSYQSVLRSILSNGTLDPDYRRDITGILTPAYRAEDAYAGVLISALGALGQGITTIVDTSQVSHTPEHTDACIRAFQEAGIRTVFAYSRGEPPETQYPQDLGRLQRTYFSSQDQLMTLALGLTLVPELFAAAREAGVPAVSHGVNDGTETALFALYRAAFLAPTRSTSTART
jgi:5-methylthioadenosine/S-adenosylhomocysteine deaminase